MAIRFLAMVPGRDGDRALAHQVRSRLANRSGGMRVSDDGRLLVAVSGEPVIELARGVIIGPLFDRRYPALVRQLGEAEQQRIADSQGRCLIETYWGGYVALLSDGPDDVHAIRAPFGELPCYRLTLATTTVLSSDPGLLVDAGLLDPKLAWGAIIRELAWRDLRGSETCLAGLDGLRGGDRLTIRAGESRIESLWNPWEFTVANGQPIDEVVDHVRRDTQSCIAARASQFDRTLLLLSGGLDSSIVAAGLAGGSRPFSLATFTTRDPLGDERDYGRSMATAVGEPLLERMRQVDAIKPGHTPAARLPRPAGRLFEQESLRIASEIAAGVGAQAIFTGGGGDNVFCALQSAAPAADRLLCDGPGRGFLATAREIGRVAPASVPAVIRSAAGRIWPWKRRSPAVPDLRFLSAEAKSEVRMEPPHPWLVARRGTLPGKAAHIKLLAYAESFAQGTDPQAEPPTIAPLLSQPLVETCLSVESWRWFEDGRNRAIARRAFAPDLPEKIALRRSKGTPDSFVAEIYERYRLPLRERLLGGLLAQQRIIDPSAVQDAFDEAGPVVPADYRRLLRLVDVENWARVWAERVPR